MQSFVKINIWYSASFPCTEAAEQSLSCEHFATCVFKPSVLELGLGCESALLCFLSHLCSQGSHSQSLLLWLFQCVVYSQAHQKETSAHQWFSQTWERWMAKCVVLCGPPWIYNNKELYIAKEDAVQYTLMFHSPALVGEYSLKQ